MEEREGRSREGGREGVGREGGGSRVGDGREGGREEIGRERGWEGRRIIASKASFLVRSMWSWVGLYIYLSLFQSCPGSPHAMHKCNWLSEIVQYETTCVGLCSLNAVVFTDGNGRLSTVACSGCHSTLV